MRGRGGGADGEGAQGALYRAERRAEGARPRRWRGVGGRPAPLMAMELGRPFRETRGRGCEAGALNQAGGGRGNDAGGSGGGEGAGERWVRVGHGQGMGAPEVGDAPDRWAPPDSDRVRESKDGVEGPIRRTREGRE
jgi:hypothetical protein